MGLQGIPFPPMRQKGIIPIGPQRLIQSLDPLRIRGLHNNIPRTFK
jgi:hypothetical protein